MFKKNSWIVALLVALSFSIFFIGCVDPLVEDNGDEDETFTEFELTGFNLWGGNAENQAGWGTDGATYSNGKKTVASIGLTVEMLQNAKYLVLEMNDGYPKNNVETIYDSWAADGTQLGSWQQLSTFATGAGVPIPGLGAKQEGNTYTLELSKVLKNYGTFIDKDTAAISLYIQHWGNGGTVAAIKSAKLLIAEPKFIPVTNITIPATITGNVLSETELSATVVPDDASLQKIIWSIVGFLPEGDADTAANWKVVDDTSDATITSSTATLLGYVDFKKVTRIDTPASGYYDYSCYPPRWITVPAVTTPLGAKSPNVIIPTAPGKVRVQAMILEGGADGADFIKVSHDIVVTNIIPYTVPASGDGFFYVDLNDWRTVGTDTVNATLPIGETATGKITLTFTENNQRVNFKFTDAQIALFKALSGSVAVDITGAATTGAGGAGDKFRYHIGDATVGSSWNATDGAADNSAFTNSFDATLTFNANTTAREYLIIQHRDAASVTIEITSIKITYNAAGTTSVDVDGTATPVTVKGRDANMYKLANGFVYSGINGSYGNSYPIFEVNLGTDTLADFSEINFTYQGLSGDIGYKDVRALAFAAEPTGNIQANQAGGALGLQNYASNGQAPIAVTISNGGAGGWALTDNTVWIMINLHSGNAAFVITDIEFVK